MRYATILTLTIGGTHFFFVAESDTPDLYPGQYKVTPAASYQDAVNYAERIGAELIRGVHPNDGN